MKLFASVLLILISCNTLPEIRPFVSNNHTVTDPKKIFLNNKSRLFHSIEADLPGGSKGFVMGITVADPATQTLHSVIMSYEGLVLFEAVYDKSVVIKRGIGQFNSKEFADGLINDIRLIFFAPSGNPAESGELNNKSVFRYNATDDKIIDIILIDDLKFKINVYSKEKSLIRTLQISLCEDKKPLNKNALPCNIHLKAPGLMGYSLNMVLIKREDVSE